MSGWLDGVVLNVLQKGLNASNMRQQVLANNVANVDTPNFKRSDVDFQSVMKEALGDKSGAPLSMKMTAQKHLPGVIDSNSLRIVTDQSTTLRNDGNNVDIDREMTNVAENGLYYESLTRALSSQLDLLKLVIK
ncbi:flagellar basal body rod protein FlgB [Desulfosporosinus sp. PR]|uniref:flagellar basal body rod protein FlgB n=1 Tax=Candidatus Desulfosporosinus nitrosoreducens TaxID=3401928 RepID=UPI0027FBA8F2|nr:flagellar basal body rod protein FlgB [Desulfosporosinus sp. PR]MDQ7096210.1 flagellar basal body rod protein FlgB [Desulfosporosinus sp. PR]